MDWKEEAAIVRRFHVDVDDSTVRAGSQADAARALVEQVVLPLLADEWQCHILGADIQIAATTRARRAVLEDWSRRYPLPDRGKHRVDPAADGVSRDAAFWSWVFSRGDFGDMQAVLLVRPTDRELRALFRQSIDPNITSRGFSGEEKTALRMAKRLTDANDAVAILPGTQFATLRLEFIASAGRMEQVTQLAAREVRFTRGFVATFGEC